MEKLMIGQRRIILVVLLAMVLIGGCATVETTAFPTPISKTSTSTTTTTPTSAATSDKPVCPEGTALITEETKASIRRVVDSGESVGIVVGIVTPCGKEYYSHGMTALSDGQEVNEDTVFEIGSVTKTFTALLLAKMAEEGKVASGDYIEKYLPENVTTPTFLDQSIRMVDLATHTSGLPSLPPNLRPTDEMNPYADYTVENMYAALEEYTLTRKPGSVYEYSNWGMGLLGHILTLQSGISYEELVITRITDELGMPDTRITLTPRMQEHLAKGYRDKVPFPLWDLPTLAGAGALRSTALDMLTYLAANMGLQESRLYSAMQVTHQFRHVVDPGKMQIGLGWHILTLDDGQKVIEHHGGTGGFASYVGFIKEKQTGAVVLTNTYLDIDYIGHELLGVGTAP
jgi:serine-type D-Ala-D-Ala carboxypeptidase/endopeptidase